MDGYKGRTVVGIWNFPKFVWCIFVMMYPTTNGGHIKINKNVYDSMVSQGIFKFYFGTFAPYCYKIALYFN